MKASESCGDRCGRMEDVMVAKADLDGLPFTFYCTYCQTILTGGTKHDRPQDNPT